MLVVGGDKFTLAKVADCVESGIAVVIVNESGPIPELLADIYHAFDSKHPQWVFLYKSHMPFVKMSKVTSISDWNIMGTLSTNIPNIVVPW